MKGAWSQRRLVEAGRSWLALCIVLALSAGGVALSRDRNAIQLVTNFFILCTLIVSLQAFVGNSGIVSFGNLAFFATGAYATALLTMAPEVKEVAVPLLPPILLNAQLQFLPAILGGTIVAGALALLTGLPLTRMQANAAAMATLALLVIVHTSLNNWEAVTRGAKGLYDIPRRTTLLMSLIGLVAISGLAFLYKASPIGLRLQATREDPLAAQSLGIAVGQSRLVGWIMGGLLMGAGGSLWAQNVLAFGPDRFFFRDTFNMLAMLVIGGQVSVTGAIAGTLVFTVISELLRPLESGLVIGAVELPRLDGVVAFSVALLILGVLIFRPTGLLGSWELTLPRWPRSANPPEDAVS